MCTATVAQEILDALQSRLDNGSVFTAFDVTGDVRDKNPGDKIKHRDVRRIVHEEYQTGQFPDNYNRQDGVELDVPQSPLVIVYYPDGKTALDHPKALQSTAPQTATVAPPSVSRAATSTSSNKGGCVKDGNGFICSETSKGVINFPDAIVKAVTPSGGTYDIIIGGDTVYKAPDGQGRLRISSSKLGGGDRFKLTVDTSNNTIVVETA